MVMTVHTLSHHLRPVSRHNSSSSTGNWRNFSGCSECSPLLTLQDCSSPAIGASALQPAKTDRQAGTEEREHTGVKRLIAMCVCAVSAATATNCQDGEVHFTVHFSHQVLCLQRRHWKQQQSIIGALKLLHTQLVVHFS